MTHALFLYGAMHGILGIEDWEEVSRQVTMIMAEADMSAEQCADITYDDTNDDRSLHENETNYRGNLRKWFGTKPFTRLWMLRRLCFVQQRAQKELLRVAGPEFGAQQI